MNNIKKYIIKTILFLVIAAIAVYLVKGIYNSNDQVIRQKELYENQPTNSIDIAFIGSSSTYRYYDVMKIWGDYGITSMCYTLSSMPYDLIEPMIEYVEENQDPEVYVIDMRHVLRDEWQLNCYGEYARNTVQEAFIYGLSFFSAGDVKDNLIEGNEYISESDVEDTILSNFFNENETTIFSKELEYKGNRIAFKSADLSEDYVDFKNVTEREYNLTDETQSRLDELFEYCEENEINVLYTFTPYVNALNTRDIDIRREIENYIVESGFTFIDYKAQLEDIGLDPSKDYYDTNHVNYWGAEKYTSYFMEDIILMYDFDNEYSQDVISSWDSEYEKWLDYTENK